MFSRAFALATFERAAKSFAQAAVAFLTTNATGLLDVDFGQGASVAGLVALLSVLSSFASGVVTTQPGPSLVPVEVLKETPAA